MREHLPMKKILLITENLGSGGAERQLTGLAVLLKERGYNVRFVTYIEKQFYLPYLKKHGVDYKLLLNAGNKYTRVFYLLKEMQQYKPDAVISYLTSTNVSMCLTRLLYKTKLIVSERSHTLVFSFKTRLKFHLYGIADYIVANSSSEENNIKDHFPVLASKTLSIHNFIDTEKFKPAYPKKENLLPVIYCVGRVIPSKNVLNMLKAIRSAFNMGFNFNVIWRGSQYDTAYCNEVESMVERLKLNDHFFLKDQSDNLLPEYQNADIFCLPSFYEGYPNVICEAMSCGLPVICSNVCENSNIVKENINGFLFDPHNPDDIADAIVKVLSMSEEERNHMCVQNRKDIESNNSAAKFIDKYISLL